LIMRPWILPAVLSLCALTLGPSRALAQEVPAGSVLELRLRDLVSSFRAKRGAVFRAVLIAPVRQDGRELLPAGLEVNGHVAAAKRVGLGLIRERARLRLQFDSLVLPGGTPIPLEGTVVEVENAREKLLEDGTIVGIRATDSYGHQATGMVSSVAAFDPMLMLFAFAASSSVLRFPEAEITYPAGTELRLKLLKPLQGMDVLFDPLPEAEQTDIERVPLEMFINELPYRTHIKAKNTPSDLTNLVFLGNRSELLQAFAAAGWTLADGRDPATSYKTVRALAESQGYAEAPVSVLLLDGKPPQLVFEKTLNSVNKRHHLRVWQIEETWNGETVWTAAATHDIGLGFSSHKTVIHRVDPNIDQEREKISDDLRFAGCATVPEMVERPHVPRVTQNATGDQMVTDGRAAVLRLIDCSGPDERALRVRKEQAFHTGNPVYRGVRQFDLTLRNALVHDNMAWQAYSTGRIIWKMAHHHSQSPRPAAGLFPTTDGESNSESELHLAVASAFSPAQSAESRPRLPEVAFSLDGGESFRLHLGDLFLASVDPATGIESVYQYSMRIEPGAVLGSSVTLHPSGFLSHEIYFGTVQANLLSGDDPSPQVDRIKMRTAGYQLEGNLAPRRWRLRPFLCVGGSLTTYRFKDIKLSKKDGVFKFALRRVGTIVSAFNSAGVAPLDGGSVFQPALTYGGGMKLRVTRLLEFQAEYRENYAKDPEFFNTPSLNLSSQGITSAQDPGSRRHSTYLLSLSFTP
jgi:LssY C-terminus